MRGEKGMVARWGDYQTGDVYKSNIELSRRVIPRITRGRGKNQIAASLLRREPELGVNVGALS